MNDIKTNSKDIVNGDIFVCTLGLLDKTTFIDEVGHLCSEIITNKDVNTKYKYTKVNDIDKYLIELLDKRYNYPLKNTNLIGITGTDGKTTLATILKNMLNSASIGTNGLEYNNIKKSLKNTTPSLDILYRSFKEIKDNNINNIIMEVSSESYLTNRIPNLKFNIGIFTNITDEHLDKHPDFDNYFNCKMKLLENSNIQIINHDSPYYNDIIKHCNNYYTYGYKESDITIIDYKLNIDNTDIIFKYNNDQYNINIPLVGKFNVENIICAILTLLKLNYNINDIISLLKNIKPVSGRMDIISKNPFIVVDYAHTIEATKNVLEFYNKFYKDKIITIVGCAGSRYIEKRPLIGQTVQKNSKLVIYTMDDPRNEDVNDIIEQMIYNTLDNYIIKQNRSEAIKLGIELAKQEKYMLLILGKGRDEYMAIGNEYIHYSDIEEINKYIGE